MQSTLHSTCLHFIKTKTICTSTYINKTRTMHMHVQMYVCLVTLWYVPQCTGWSYLRLKANSNHIKCTTTAKQLTPANPPKSIYYTKTYRKVLEIYQVSLKKIRNTLTDALLITYTFVHYYLNKIFLLTCCQKLKK